VVRNVAQAIALAAAPARKIQTEGESIFLVLAGHTSTGDEGQVVERRAGANLDVLMALELRFLDLAIHYKSLSSVFGQCVAFCKGLRDGERRLTTVSSA
jgi:hypothetical protein